MAKPFEPTLEERSVQGYPRPAKAKTNQTVPSVAKCAGYRLTHPKHEPNYVPSLGETVDSIRDYSEKMRQKAEESTRKYKRESKYRL